MLKSIESHTLADDGLEVTANLIYKNQIFTATVQRTEAQETTIYLAVRATLNAISQSLVRPVNFEISAINIRELEGSTQPYIVLLVKTDYFMPPVREVIELLGSCKLTQPEIDAAARAALNATNRTVSLLLSGGKPTTGL